MIEHIPFKYVGQETWNQLANKLDPDVMNGNNWKLLAEKLGYSVEDILNIECRQTQHGRNTLKLFEDYVKRKGNSVTQVRKSLEVMERPDALDVLLGAIPGIEQRYTADKKKTRMKKEPFENSCSFQSHCSQNCGTRVSSNPQHHPHHMNLQVCQSQYSRCNSQHCPDIMSRSMMPSRSMHTTITKELNTMPQSYGYSTSTGMHQSVGRPQCGHSQYTTSLSSNSITDESMEVNIDHSDHYLHDSVAADMETDWPREEKAPVPLTIYKGKNNLPSLSRIPPLLSYDEMLVGGEEEVETTENRIVHTPTHFHRQVSEEMNTNQPLVDPSSHVMPASLALNAQVRPRKVDQNTADKKPFFCPSPSTPGNPLAKLQQFTNSESYMPNKEYNTIMAAKNREELLYNRNGLDDLQFKLRAGEQITNGKEPQPDEDFKRIFNFGTRNPGRSRMLLDQQQQQNRVTPTQEKAATNNKEPPKTFPLRAKALRECASNLERSPDDGSQESTSGLCKSQSLPDDMKPAEYQRKNFWHIKVFVTYSNDSKRHIQRVLNLCRCLEKNGFTCCMDMYDHTMDSNNRVEWCNQRFQEADFVLVCVSQNYLTKATCMVENNDSTLHTSYIYQLMESEIQNGVFDVERRFIPLLFEGCRVEDIPRIMQNRLFYQWPKQYRDLLWYLTKPETRTKTKVNNYVEQCPKSPKTPNIPT